MGAVFPGAVAGVHHAEPRLMHQGGGLQRLTGGFLRHAGRGEPAQFAIDQR